jgi:hypothetical protein
VNRNGIVIGLNYDILGLDWDMKAFVSLGGFIHTWVIFFIEEFFYLHRFKDNLTVIGLFNLP